MTVLSNQPGFADRLEVTAPVNGRAIAVRWEISRAAICASRPDLVPSAASAAPVLLEWRIERANSGAIVGSASLFDPQWNRRIPLMSTSDSLFEQGRLPTWIEDHSMLHIDIPELLLLTVRKASQPSALLYARTNVLATLGLPGGRYESATLAT